MLEPIYNQMLFYISLVLVLFLPGWFLLSAVDFRNKLFFSFEKFILSLGLSIVITNFLIILTNLAGIPITALAVISSIFIFCLACFFAREMLRKKYSKSLEPDSSPAFFASRNTAVLFFLIFLFTVIVKLIFVAPNIIPGSTDLGHHMYWAKIIVETHHLPIYTESDIYKSQGEYRFGNPQPISDFIVGEHLIFAAVHLISGAEFTSSFSIIMLFIIEIFGLLTAFILANRLFSFHRQALAIAILSLLFAGPFFAIAPPAEKYVVGGVLGNIFGNLLIPLFLYFFYRAFQEKSRQHLVLALIIFGGLLYVHHLSSLILLITIASGIVFYLVNQGKEILTTFKEKMAIFLAPGPIITLATILIFLFIIYPPSYIANQAATTVVGDATEKVEHLGLTIPQLKAVAGEPRIAIGLIGIFLLVFFFRKRLAAAIIFGWTVPILFISLKPEWAGLDLPTGRLANYLALPLALCSGFAFYWILEYARDKFDWRKRKLVLAFMALILAFFAMKGLADNASYLATSSGSAQQSFKIFRISEYLASKTTDKEMIVHDHINIPSDSWIKLFFMRDYDFPVYRALAFRYERSSDKQEWCTLDMISTPNSPAAEKCFRDLNVSYAIINDNLDGPAFAQTKKFMRVYADGTNAVYTVNNKK